MAKVCWVDTRILIHSNKTGLPFRDNSNKSQNYTDKPPKTKKLGRLCGCSEPFEVESESAGQRSRRVNGRRKQRFAPSANIRGQVARRLQAPIRSTGSAGAIAAKSPAVKEKHRRSPKKRPAIVCRSELHYVFGSLRPAGTPTFSFSVSSSGIERNTSPSSSRSTSTRLSSSSVPCISLSESSSST